jgi:hypothetical protein
MNYTILHQAFTRRYLWVLSYRLANELFKTLWSQQWTRLGLPIVVVACYESCIFFAQFSPFVLTLRSLSVAWRNKDEYIHADEDMRRPYAEFNRLITWLSTWRKGVQIMIHISIRWLYSDLEHLTWCRIFVHIIITFFVLPLAAKKSRTIGHIVCMFAYKSVEITVVVSRSFPSPHKRIGLIRLYILNNSLLSRNNSNFKSPMDYQVYGNH